MAVRQACMCIGLSVMGTIFYSINGDGRGHATRVKTLVEKLRDRHKIHLLTSGDAFDLLQAAYLGIDGVFVHKIKGLSFKYKRGKVNYVRCLAASIPFAWKMKENAGRIANLIDRYGCDLAISDFEPLLPRAIAKSKIPLISIDHQQWLTISDFSKLPWSLRWKTWFIGLSIPLFYKNRQNLSIVSSFFHPPLKKGVKNALQVGVMLRQEIVNARPRHGEHILVYLRRFGRDNLTTALKSCNRPVKIYGLGELPADSNITYHAIDEDGFLNDLVNCHALISNAGNQLVGEAMYLQKPVLALPESGNFEQMLNAHYVEESGCGVKGEFDRINETDLQRFLDQVENLRLHCVPDRVAGNETVLSAILKFLERPNIHSKFSSSQGQVALQPHDPVVELHS
jgi:uncharacterized protein (TIGR00661 family)